MVTTKVVVVTSGRWAESVGKNKVAAAHLPEVT